LIQIVDGMVLFRHLCSGVAICANHYERD
jgi:hypothetical protein